MEERHAGRLVVAGQGYVGLPLAMTAVEAGWQVVGVDTDDDRVRRLRAGDSYVEDVPSERLRVALRGGRYRACSDYDDATGFDVAVVTVPTPLTDGRPDTGYICSAASSVGTLLEAGSTVVLESTTYPGTTRQLLTPILEHRSGLVAGRDFHVGYSPERVDPGNRSWTLATTPKVVSGIDKESLVAVERFYDTLVQQTVPVSEPEVAELTKLLENTFRHVNIALVNELAIFAHELGLDIWEAVEAASTKPFGFMAFRPGPGVGGHCLPVDPSYLSWHVQRALGRPFRFVELANDVNDHMPEWVVRRVADRLNADRRAVNGSSIVLIGLAYKRGTGDARESPAVRVAELLRERGARLVAVDAHVDARRLDLPVAVRPLDEQLLESADLVVVLTDHDDVDWALVERYAEKVLDTRGRVRGSATQLSDVGHRRATVAAGPGLARSGSDAWWDSSREGVAATNSSSPSTDCG